MYYQTLEKNKELIPALFRLMHESSHWDIDGYQNGEYFCNKFNCEYTMPEMVDFLIKGLSIEKEYAEYANWAWENNIHSYCSDDNGGDE
jgi:hypothetical protein